MPAPSLLPMRGQTTTRKELQGAAIGEPSTLALLPDIASLTRPHRTFPAYPLAIEYGGGGQGPRADRGVKTAGPDEVGDDGTAAETPAGGESGESRR